MEIFAGPHVCVEEISSGNVRTHYQRSHDDQRPGDFSTHDAERTLVSKNRGRKVRVDLRKNRGKPARDKSEWTRKHREGDRKSEETQQVENVRAKGDLSRKRTIIVEDGASESKTLRAGVVVTVRGLICEVDDGEAIWACTVRGIVRTRPSTSERPSPSATESTSSRSHMAKNRPDDQRVAGSPEGVIEDVEPGARFRAAVRATRASHRRQRRPVVTVMAADQPTLLDRTSLIDTSSPYTKAECYRPFA
jgi:hypothetical protein